MIQTRQGWQTNEPHPLAVLMAMAVRRSNTDNFAQYGMSRANPESAGCRHQVTTHSVLPQRLLGQQQTKQRWKNVPKRLAILMAVVVRRYNIVHIAQKQRFRALLDATKRRHRASIVADSCNWSSLSYYFLSFFIINLYKKVAGQR
jgi:hypothetical protein